MDPGSFASQLNQLHPLQNKTSCERAAPVGLEGPEGVLQILALGLWQEDDDPESHHQNDCCKEEENLGTPQDTFQHLSLDTHKPAYRPANS